MTSVTTTRSARETRVVGFLITARKRKTLDIFNIFVCFSTVCAALSAAQSCITILTSSNPNDHSRRGVICTSVHMRAVCGSRAFSYTSYLLHIDSAAGARSVPHCRTQSSIMRWQPEPHIKSTFKPTRPRLRAPSNTSSHAARGARDTSCRRPARHRARHLLEGLVDLAHVGSLDIEPRVELAHLVRELGRHLAPRRPE